MTYKNKRVRPQILFLGAALALFGAGAALTQMDSGEARTGTNTDFGTMLELRQNEEVQLGQTATGTGEMSPRFDERPVMPQPVVDAYHNGQRVWLTPHETSDRGLADRFTDMIRFPVLHAPQLDGVGDGETARLYIFTNGVFQENVRPWGGGPFNYQISVVEAVPGDTEYSPLLRPHLVTWEDGANPRVLTSAQEVRDAEDAGDLRIEEMNDAVVNAPVVWWPSRLSELVEGDEELMEKLRIQMEQMERGEGQMMMPQRFPTTTMPRNMMPENVMPRGNNMMR